MATPQFIAREEGGLSHSSPGQEARGVSYREVQLGSQARSSSEVRACRCELVLRHWRPPPEPRVGRGSALPRRERGCLSGPWLPVPLCSPQMRMPVTQHPCDASQLLCYIKSYLFLTRQSGRVFFFVVHVLYHSSISTSGFIPRIRRVRLISVFCTRSWGHWLVQGLGKCAGGGFTLWGKDACRGRVWPTSLVCFISCFC